MSETEYSIQELSDQSGTSRRTIHFYTQQEILPPPSGAGLGARYDEGHLLRLQLVQLLRGEGLRLDQIRQQLRGLDIPTLRQMRQERLGNLELLRLPAAPALDPLAERTAEIAPPAWAAPVPQPRGERFTHFTLRPGWMLVVPAGLTPADQRRLELLLAAAARILSPAPVPPKE